MITREDVERLAVKVEKLIAVIEKDSQTILKLEIENTALRRQFEAGQQTIKEMEKEMYQCKKDYGC